MLFDKQEYFKATLCNNWDQIDIRNNANPNIDNQEIKKRSRILRSSGKSLWLMANALAVVCIKQVFEM